MLSKTKTDRRVAGIVQRLRKRDAQAAARTETHGVLVAVGGNALDEAVIRAATMEVKGTKRPLYAVHVIEIPWTEPVDNAPSVEEVIHADTILENATALANKYGHKLEPELLQARTAGAAIVDEAAARECSLILLGLPYKREHTEFCLGDTIPYVLEHSPVEVWIIRGVPDSA
jgi:nucleotide-binding universal stress UspA family protein